MKNQLWEKKYNVKWMIGIEKKNYIFFMII